MAINRSDVKAVQLGDKFFHLDCVPNNKWSDLTEEDFLTEDDWDDNVYEFCCNCGKII